MKGVFSDRIADVPRSFIREILKVALDHTVISFAGGLPNRDENLIRTGSERLGQAVRKLLQ